MHFEGGTDYKMRQQAQREKWRKQKARQRAKKKREEQQRNRMAGSYTSRTAKKRSTSN